MYTLTPVDDGTHVTLTQDNNGSEDEAKRSTENWQHTLEGIKQHAEG